MAPFPAAQFSGRELFWSFFRFFTEKRRMIAIFSALPGGMLRLPLPGRKI